MFLLPDMELVVEESLDSEDEDGNPVTYSPASRVPSLAMISSEDMLLDTSKTSAIQITVSIPVALKSTDIPITGPQRRETPHS